MSQSRSEQESEVTLCEHYRRQYGRNRDVHLRNSSDEIAERRRLRARRKRFAAYFILVVLVSAMVAALAFAVVTIFYN